MVRDADLCSTQLRRGGIGDGGRCNLLPLVGSTILISSSESWRSSKSASSVMKGTLLYW